MAGELARQQTNVVLKASSVKAKQAETSLRDGSSHLRVKSQVAGDKIKQRSKAVGEVMKEKSHIAGETLKTSTSKARNDFKVKQNHAGHILKEKTDNARETVKFKANQAMLSVKATSIDPIGNIKAAKCSSKEEPKRKTKTMIRKSLKAMSNAILRQSSHKLHDSNVSILYNEQSVANSGLQERYGNGLNIQFQHNDTRTQVISKPHEYLRTNTYIQNYNAIRNISNKSK